jgi:hypothetical protein
MKRFIIRLVSLLATVCLSRVHSPIVVLSRRTPFAAVSRRKASMATRAVLQTFERYQKERVAFVSQVAEMAKSPQVKQQNCFNQLK